jgi:hypothetical protein
MISEKMIDAGLAHYAEGGCSGLDERERREVVTDILTAALSAMDAEPRKKLTKEEFQKLLNDERSFKDTDPEAAFIAHAGMSCPYCGGSGHKDDVALLHDTGEVERQASNAPTRQIVTDTLTILRRLADGDTIVYSQDGDTGWFTKGDRAFVGDEIMTLRSCGFIKREIDPNDETDNYRGMAEYDTITEVGRKYLKEQSR